MIDFEELESSLKTKWLDYYESNQSWISKYASRNFCHGSLSKTARYELILDSPLRLAVISILEPKVKDWLEFLCETESDPDKIIVALGLNFNPEEILKQQEQNNKPSENITISQIDSSNSQLTKFENLKEELKEKWLNYCQSNQFWMNKLGMWQKINKESNEKRPTDLFILGFALTIQPKLTKLLIPFFRINPSVDKIILKLGLDFDPRIELENRDKNNQSSQLINSYFPHNSDLEELEKIRAEIREKEQNN
jgi:hypothetical protein